jgi:periplasmic protein TonB
MRLGRALAIGGSIALHVGAVAGILLLAASLRQPEPLFVDLTTGDSTPGNLTAGGGAASDRAGEEHRPAVRSYAGSKSLAPASREPERASARATPPAEPARPAEVAPAPEPPRPLSGEMTRADPPPAPVADSPADGGGSGPPVAPRGGSGTGVASDAPSGTGPRSSAGGGSRLALAGPGAGRSEIPAEFGPYLASFRRRIQELVVYPLSARRRGVTGKVEVEVVLEPTGRVRDVAVVASSAHSMLDDAALDAVRSLPPVPLPENLPRRPLRVRLPIVFDLR